jgi:FkbM family methyltransferase
MGLYDPLTDTLRFSEPAEAMRILCLGMIADAVPWMLKIEGYIPDGGIVVDVGAFRGITGQWFAKRARHVFCFEPTPESAESIRLVLKVRNIGNVSVHQIALSDRVGVRPFHVLTCKGHNSLGPVKTSQHLYMTEVATTTLDDFADENGIGHIDFLKVDVEGFEHEVIAGANRLLLSRRIGVLLFEVNRPVLSDVGMTAAPIYDALHQRGYDLDGRAVSRSEIVVYEWGDLLARPRS